MARYSRKKNSNTISNMIGIVLFLLVISIVSIGAYYYYNNIQEKKNIDKKTMCNNNINYSKNIVLLDMTDSYSYIQISDIKLRIENLIRSLPEGEQLKVYFLKDIVDETVKPAITICNPGRGEGKSYLYSNPKLIEKKWEDQFYKPLKNTINAISDGKTYSTSPIIEIIQLINILEFKSHINDFGKNKLIIISDMIQNSKEYSFFRNDVDIKRFNQSTYFDKYKSNMMNFEVDLMFIRRTKYKELQSQRQVDFWINYFTIQNAEINKIIKVDG